MQPIPMTAEIIRTENSSDRIYDRHCHAHYGILFVLDGSIRIRMEGQPLLLEKNMGILIEPLKYHIVTGNNTRYHRLILSFQKEAIPATLLSDFQTAIAKNFVFYADGIAQLFRKFAFVWETHGEDYAPLLTALLTEALYALTYENDAPAEAAGGKKAEKLRGIISYVDENLGNEIRLADAAAAMYMSESALCHLFKEEMKISLKQYILQKKILYAKSLLQQGTPPSAAAAACGYKNYPSFYKIFLKMTGIPPAQVMQE